MLQIVYTSTANHEFSALDIERLVAGARARNKAIGVTGMLLFHDGTFLQAIEGEQRAVNEVFASIQRDARHRDIAVLHRGPGFEQRVFGDGPLGFADFDGAADLLRAFMSLNERPRIKDLDRARAMALLAACGGEDMLGAVGA
jgi:Sensors of blue-light using FAD